MITYDTVLDALADRTRRRILEELRVSPQPVGELASRLPVTQPAISQHLKVLRAAELVYAVPDGARRIYHVSAAGLNTLRAYVDSLWDDALTAFADSVKKEER